MNKITMAIHNHKWIISLLMVVLIVGVMAIPCLAADEPTGDVASAVESTWTDAKEQVTARSQEKRSEECFLKRTSSPGVDGKYGRVDLTNQF